MAKGCVLSTGYLPQGGLPRNSVDRITYRPDMTSAVDRGRRASTQTKKHAENAPFYISVLPFSNPSWSTALVYMNSPKINMRPNLTLEKIYRSRSTKGNCLSNYFGTKAIMLHTCTSPHGH